MMILLSLQGAIVALIYCFFNGEVTTILPLFVCVVETKCNWKIKPSEMGFHYPRQLVTVRVTLSPPKNDLDL